MAARTASTHNKKSVGFNKVLCAQPWATAHTTVFFSVLSPVAWWRTATFKRVDLRPLWMSSVALVLPHVLFSLYVSISSNSSRGGGDDRTKLSEWTTTAGHPSRISQWLTPWTAAFAWKASAALQQLWRARKELTAAHATTKESAWECLANEVALGRAYRCRGYDVYTPPATTTITTSIKRPILFFPGALVECTAYAPVAALFAKAGYLVVVVSAEPLRMVDEWLLPPTYIRRICSTVEKRHCCGGDWVLAGHSMGSFLCTKLARTLNVKQIIMWGSAPFIDFMSDISDADDIHCLVVHAQNDIVVDAFATEAATKRFWELLPSKTTVPLTIQGGTHSGFGSYVGVWKPEVNGISEEEQHNEAVQITVDFLEGH